jgi:plasmid stability protein
MAKLLQVRNLPDDVHETLRRRAAAAGLSMSEYVGRQLADLARTRDLDEIFAEVEREGSTVPMADIVALIRADRDSR